MRRSRYRDTQTLDMFRDIAPPDEVAAKCDPAVTKGGTLDVKIARAVAVAMERSGKSRAVIAEEMTEFLGGDLAGQKVTKNMLDQYASPAKSEHRITFERLIALTQVTGHYGLLAFYCEQFRYVAVPEAYSDIIEIWREEREIEERTRRRDARLARLRDLK